MSLIAIVPVKGLASCKQRLAGVLAPAQRAQLCLAMLSDVVAALQGARGVDATWVTSPDPAVLAAAAAAGAVPVPDRAGSLNGALAAALAAAAGAGATASLLVQGDLPGLSAAEVEALVAAAPGPGAAVAIAPARDGGTGALYLRPPGAIAPHFGPDSSARHAAAAAAAGLPVASVHLPGLALDLDRPEDLARFLALGRPGKALALLRSAGVGQRVV